MLWMVATAVVGLRPGRHGSSVGSQPGRRRGNVKIHPQTVGNPPAPRLFGGLWWWWSLLDSTTTTATGMMLLLKRPRKQIVHVPKGFLKKGIVRKEIVELSKGIAVGMMTTTGWLILMV